MLRTRVLSIPLAVTLALMLALPHAEAKGSSPSSGKKPNGYSPCTPLKTGDPTCLSGHCTLFTGSNTTHCTEDGPNGKACKTKYDCLSLFCKGGKCTGRPRNDPCDIDSDGHGNLNPLDGQCATGSCKIQKDGTGLCKDKPSTANGEACRYDTDCASRLCTVPLDASKGSKGRCWNINGHPGDPCKVTFDCASTICTSGKCVGRANGVQCTVFYDHNSSGPPQPVHAMCASGLCRLRDAKDPAQGGICTAKA